MRRGLLLLTILALILPGVSAATIQGNVYDFSLESITAIVEINSTPQQKMVAQGEYRFEVEPGSYQLTARQVKGGTVEAAVQENITITGNGSYTLDLILFPQVDVNESLGGINNPGVEPEEFSYIETFNAILPYLAVLSVLIILWGLHYTHKQHLERQKTQDWEESDLELDEDAQKILEYIDREKRTTQKKVREKFSYSQSKISLILTELEDKGLIKKIKRGRGNVIIRN